MNGVLPVTTLYFQKFCFSLRTSCKELIWCINDPNANICTCFKRWSFIWLCFFPVSILKPGHWNFMHVMVIELHFRERGMLKAPSKSAFRKSLLMIIYLTYISSWRQKSQVSFATFLRMRPVNCVCKFDYSAILCMCSTSEYCTQIKILNT